MANDIRPYHEEDYDAARALWVELTEHHRDIYRAPGIGGDDPGAYFDEFLASTTRAQAWVAAGDGRVVGLAGLLLEGTEGEVEPVIVAAVHRGRGIGRALVESVIAEARRRGVTHLKIRPVARNSSAIAAFHGYGFRTLGHLDMFMDLRDDPGDWVDGIEIHGLGFEY